MFFVIIVVFLFKRYFRGSSLLLRSFSWSGKSELPTESPWTRRASVYCIQETSPCCHRTHLLNEFLKSWLLGSYFTRNSDIAMYVSFSSLTILLEADSPTVHINTIKLAHRFHPKRVHHWSPVVLVLSAKLEDFDKTGVMLHVQRTFAAF